MIGSVLTAAGFRWGPLLMRYRRIFVCAFNATSIAPRVFCSRGVGGRGATTRNQIGYPERKQTRETTTGKEVGLEKKEILPGLLIIFLLLFFFVAVVAPHSFADTFFFVLLCFRHSFPSWDSSGLVSIVYLNSLVRAISCLCIAASWWLFEWLSAHEQARTDLFFFCFLCGCWRLTFFYILAVCMCVRGWGGSATRPACKAARRDACQRKRTLVETFAFGDDSCPGDLGTEEERACF